jgi:hypothetical protein
VVWQLAFRPEPITTPINPKNKKGMYQNTHLTTQFRGISSAFDSGTAEGISRTVLIMGATAILVHTLTHVKTIARSKQGGDDRSKGAELRLRLSGQVQAAGQRDEESEVDFVLPPRQGRLPLPLFVPVVSFRCPSSLRENTAQWPSM